MTINASKNRLLLLHKQSFHEESLFHLFLKKKAKKYCKYKLIIKEEKDINHDLFKKIF